MANKRSFLRVTATERSVLLRLTLLVVLSGASFGIIGSERFADTLGAKYMLPNGQDAILFTVVVFGCVTFFVRYRAQLRAEMLARRRGRERAAGVVCWMMAMSAAWWLTHPSPERAALWTEWVTSAGQTGVNVLSAVLYGAMLVLPMLACALIIFPWAFLRRFRGPLLFGLAVLLAYLFAVAAEAAYHQASAPTVLRMSGWVLESLPGEAVTDPRRWRIGYGSYRAIVGPACSGFTMLVLFIGMFAVACRDRKLHWLHAAAVLAAGMVFLFLCNIVRIAGIVVLGDTAPDLATQLLHDGAGGLLLFLAGWLYLRVAMGRTITCANL